MFWLTAGFGRENATNAGRSSMSDFWSRQKEKLQNEGVIPAPRTPVTQSNGPWWSHGTNLVPRTEQAQEPLQQPTRPVPSASRTDVCPNCGSGNYSKPSTMAAARCFECGHVDGRQLNDTNLMPGLIQHGDVKTLAVRQIASGGHFGRSVAEINANNAVLEQSAQGKAQVA
jgi:hypothetical protein